MKKILSFLLSLIFIFAVTGLAFAEENKEAGSSPPEAAKKETAPAAQHKKAARFKLVIGEVIEVDTTARTFTVKVEGGKITLYFDDETKIMVGQETKTLAELKAGEKVTASYNKKNTESGLKNVAKVVKIKAASEKSTSKE